MSHLYPKLALAVLTGAALLGLAWWPVSYHEAITWGIDAYQYHGPLFGQHTQSQDIVTDEPIEILGALIVRLRPSPSTPDVEVTIQNPATNEVLQTHTVPGSSLVDDAFTYVHLAPPLAAAEPIRVTFSAPTATAATALGVRFHPDDVYPAGQRLFDGKVVEGDLALSWQRRLPFWQVVQKNALNNPRTTTVLLQAALVSLLAAFIASGIAWAHQPIARQRWIELGLLSLVGAAVIAGHFPALRLMGGVSGGDPYNYLFITQGISHGENPWADKRLPGYPLLLLPAYLTSLDDQLWMRLINVVSAGGVVVLVGLLARRLKVTWSGQFFAALLLAGQKDFYWVGLRPEPYTFYAFLLMACLVLFFSLTTWRRRLLFGFLLGYAAMTRQEGFLLAAVLGAIAAGHTITIAITRALVNHQANTPRDLTAAMTLIKNYALAFVPALLVVMPFFVNNALNYGNPFYTPYFAGERLNIVDSPAAFADAVGATWGVIGSMWKTSWEQLERVSLDTPIFAVSAVLWLLWWAYHRQRAPHQTAVESTLILLLSIISIAFTLHAFTHSSLFTLFLPITAAAVLVSPFALLGTARWPGIVVALVGITQIGVATWFHPFPKHYQQDWPLIVLALVTLLIASSTHIRGGRARLAIGASYAAITFMFSLTVLPLYQPGLFLTTIDKYNHTTAVDSVVYRAIQAARELPGPYGTDQEYLATRLYFAQNGHVYPENTSPLIVDEWLTKHNIQTLITTNNSGLFKELPEGWQQVKKFKAEDKQEQMVESTVYTRTAPSQ